MALVEQTLNDLFPGIIEESARAYAEAFTLEELEQINAFYETPTGRKLVQTMPALMERVSRISERNAIEAMQAIQPQIDAIMAE